MDRKWLLLAKCLPSVHTDATFPIAGKVDNTASISNGTDTGSKLSVLNTCLLKDKTEDSGEMVVSGFVNQ